MVPADGARAPSVGLATASTLGQCYTIESTDFIISRFAFLLFISTFHPRTLRFRTLRTAVVLHSQAERLPHVAGAVPDAPWSRSLALT